MASKKSFKKGTTARASRDKVAEQLKERGYSKDSAFAIGTTVAKGVKSSAAQKRLAQHGVRKAKKKG